MDVSTAAGRAADAADAVAAPTSSVLGQLVTTAAKGPTELDRISEFDPCCHVQRYANLAVAVSNMSNSVAFYTKIGFDIVDSDKTSDNGLAVLRNRGGMELHLCPCDKPIDEDKNILMDYPEDKYPGHTHASWNVPNVQSCQEYLASQDIGISGERKYAGVLRALFARDLDRTTLEFEHNQGEPSPEGVVTRRENIGSPQCIDHIGIRVSNPEEAWKWYAEKLGFMRHVARYEPDPEPLKNFPPWIARTNTGVDINLIINANRSPEGTNILWKDGVVRPGILWATWEVADVKAAEVALRAAGVVCVSEAAMASSHLKCLAPKMVPSADGNTVFVEDQDLNLYRLVRVHHF